MRHLSNIQDHRSPEARQYFTGYTLHDWDQGPQAIEQAWQRHIDWINANVIGRPQATEKYTVEELEDMGMIGVYSPSEKGQESTL